MKTQAMLLAAAAVLVTCGCDRTAAQDKPPEVVQVIGRTGSGPGEFLYPRPIDLAADGTLWVADKTGRLQHLDERGRCLGVIHMPESDAGKPTGLTVGPNGNLYVADTHYHRVIVFSPEGLELRRFGRFGQGDGEFIYPTDVAIAPDGRLFVSEYGGNDRVSVFSADSRFLYSFGKLGSGAGELSRPNAMAVDSGRGRLYVADACNHRVVIYDLAGQPTGCIGSAGRQLGQLRYPYGVALAADGSVVVCEFGNNRVQVFSPDGRPLAIRGGPGREPGQLAFPWGVAVDGRNRIFLADAGNNRVQVWRWPPIPMHRDGDR